MITQEVSAFRLQNERVRPAEHLPAKSLRVEVFADHASAEAVWRKLETQSSISVYQRYDWARIWYDTLGKSEGYSPFIIVAHDDQGPVCLLPLAVEMKAGARLVRFMGGKHANLCQIIEADNRAPLTTSALHGVLADSAREHAIDLFHFEHQPYELGDRQNPFAHVGAPLRTAPYFDTALSSDFETFSREKRGKDGLKKLRYKRKKFQELGAVETRRPSNRLELEEIVAVFLDQKADRMHGAEKLNAFDDEKAADFVRALALDSLENASQLLDFHALWCDGTIIATFAGGIANGHYSCMINSITTDETFMKFSPGEIILADIVEELCRADLERFDLGVGEAIYKRKWCDERAMFETVHALTMRGKLIGLAIMARSNAREWIKTRPRLLRFATRIKAALS